MNEAVAGGVTAGVPQATVTEAACVADLVATDAALPELTAAGLTPETIQSDASLLLPSNAPAVVDDALTSCLDLHARLDSFVADAGVGSLDDCVIDWATTPTLLTDALIEAQPIDADRTDPTRTALLDVVRGCVADNDFATLADIDGPDELAAVLLADPFATDATSDQDPCVVESSIDLLGVERLADLGVTVADPDLLAVVDDLEDSEFDALVTSLESCGGVERLTAIVAEAESQVGPCAVTRLDDTERRDLIEDQLLGRNVLIDSSYLQNVDACTDELLTNLFGPKVEVSDEMASLSRITARAIVSIADGNEFEEQCVARGFQTLIEVDMIEAVTDIDIRFANGEPLTPADEAVLIEYQAIAAELGAVCIEPWKRIVQDLTGAGITGELAECTIETAGEGPARLIVDGLPGLIRGEAAGTFEVIDGMDLVGEAIAQCGTAADEAKWDRYIESIFGYGLDEPIEA